MVWNRDRAGDHLRITGRKGQRIRAAHLAKEPLCRECLKSGITKLGAIVDHIRPLSQGGLEVDDNRQTLCVPHSDEKTQREAAVGKRGKANPEWLERSAIPLEIVCGPPCAGKTTYAREQAAVSHDAMKHSVIDLDDIIAEQTGQHGHKAGREALDAALFERNRRLSALSRATSGKAWLIVSAPTEAERAWWQGKLGGTVTLLDPGKAACIARAGNRSPLVVRWYRESVQAWAPPAAPIQRGGDVNGRPTDPNHPWNRAG